MVNPDPKSSDNRACKCVPQRELKPTAARDVSQRWPGSTRTSWRRAETDAGTRENMAVAYRQVRPVTITS